MITIALALAAVASLATLVRRLPMQNIVAVALLGFAAACGIELLAVSASFPFQAFSKFSERLWSVLPWRAPLLWITFLLNARNLAQYLLRRDREKNFYGYKLLVLNSLFCALFWLCLDAGTASANAVKNFAGRFFSGAVILTLIFPWLLDKREKR